MGHFVSMIVSPSTPPPKSKNSVLVSSYSVNYQVKHPLIKYILHEEIFTSRNGSVWLASYWSSLKQRMKPKPKPVAIKILFHPKLLFHESDLWSMIPKHPHLAEWFKNDISCDQNLIWMVFAQYPHGDLFTRVQQLAPFPLYLVRCYFYQLLLAVKHLHDHGLCHLDISLENAMLDHKGQLKLLDLGLAQFYVPHQKWMGPYRNGKPHYWSPDIWNGLSFYGPHADLFACGVFLWCLLTAEFPFDRAVMAEDKRYQMICENKINQLLQYSKFIKRIETNTQIIDMLYRLLNPQSHLAFQTVDEVLNHEWFR